MKTADFDFDLPEDRIALHPVSPRDCARMLIVRPTDQGALSFDDRVVRDLPGLLRRGDVLVTNDTRVIPAALEGVRVRGDLRANVAFNLHKRLDGSRWLAFARPAKRLAVGDRLVFSHAGAISAPGALDATVAAKGEAGEVEIAFDVAGSELDQAIAAIGQTPLPPYIALKRGARPEDRADYQTIFARKDGAVAAPTAGLHFTPDLLDRLDAAGVERHTVTLHVGAGTFLPVKVDTISEHKMHAEWGEISAATAERLNAARAAGGRVVAVGTTALRLLESAVDSSGRIRPFAGDTSIFITPGYRFGAVDILMTNFHLPRSTLFMLVSAFAGQHGMRAAYGHAIETGYRFYSFGDASLLFRAELPAE